MDFIRGIKALKGVNLLKMSTTIAKLLHFRLTWTKRDLDYLPSGLGPKFVSARQAALPSSSYLPTVIVEVAPVASSTAATAATPSPTKRT